MTDIRSIFADHVPLVERQMILDAMAWLTMELHKRGDSAWQRLYDRVVEELAVTKVPPTNLASNLSKLIRP